MGTARVVRSFALVASVALALGAGAAQPVSAAVAIGPARAPAAATRGSASATDRLSAPVHFGLRGPVHVRRVCPVGPCQALELALANGSAAITGSPAPEFLRPALLHLAYQLPYDSVASPPPTIAVLAGGDDPTAESDLNTFSQQFGLPGCTSSSNPPCFYKYNGSGSPYMPNVSPAAYDSGSATEASLDLQTAHATCEDCRLMLVEFNQSGFTSLNQAATALAAAVAWAANNGGPGNTGASVISISLAVGGPGFTEPGVGDPAYTDYDQPGHVIVAADGDAGYQASYPAYPAANPNVVAVGGTTLSLNADGTYGGETAWGGAGSFCSTTYFDTSWQASDPHRPAEGCNVTVNHATFDMRTGGDVSADADPASGLPFYTGFDPNATGWRVGGGTSQAVPIIAGVYGLAGGYPGQAPSGGCPINMSCASYAPYAHQADPVPALHDITAGYNVADQSSCSSTLCQAGVGLDGPTGLGTPIGLGAFGGPPRPNAVTAGATALTPYSATLGATVDPQGQPGTVAHFDFGDLGQPDPYSDSTQDQPVSGDSQTFSESLTGLTPSTTYHYRVFASGPGGFGIGADATFTTAAPPPPPPHSTVATVGNQRITLITPSLLVCSVNTKTRAVTLDSTTIPKSKGAKLKFSNVAFFIDKGVKRTLRKTVRARSGRKKRVIVTVYEPNATADHVPVTLELSLAGLKAGTHTLKVRISYKETKRKHGRKTRVTVTKTLSVKFGVC